MFKLPVRYAETTIIEQVLALLQRLEDYSDNFDSVNVTVQGYPDILIGTASMESVNLDHLKGLKVLSVQEARKLFTTDTLGDATMHYRQEGRVRRV